jgi:hypothetical protein
MSNFASVVAALTAAWTKLSPVFEWLASHQGTIASTVTAVLAALASIAAGDKVNGVRMLLQVVMALLAGGAVVGLSGRLRQVQAETRSLRAAMASKPDADRP